MAEPSPGRSWPTIRRWTTSLGPPVTCPRQGSLVTWPELEDLRLNLAPIGATLHASPAMPCKIIESMRSPVQLEPS